MAVPAPSAASAPNKPMSDLPQIDPEKMAAMSAEEKDAWWYENVYRGDDMPQLTLRAVLTGGILGMLMSASNLYTTLSVGWAFGVAITASVMSFVIWSIITPIFRARKMTVLETNCMASTASAAGYSTGSTIAVMFGALVLLAVPPEGKTSADIRTFDLHPWWLLGCFTLCTGLMGVFLAIPMKRQMINQEQLPFPSGIAAAETLKSLYSGSKEAVRKAHMLVAGLAVGAVVAVLRAGEGTLPILDKFYAKTGLELPGQIPAEGFYKVNGRQMIGYGVDTSVLLLAAGMIVRLRVSLSMLAGSALLYMVVGPKLIAMDAPHILADGKFDPSYTPSIEIVGGGVIYHMYRWGLWGGTSLMVISSLTALALQWRTVARAFTGVLRKRGGTAQRDELARIEVPGKWMIVGMVPITIAMLVIQVMAFHIHWWAGIIAIAMSFVLSVVACRATGETDTTPIGAMGKVMQLMFAAFQSGQIVPNLASAGIAANSASASADLLTDLKSGYLLGANPRRQFLAQFVGVFFGTLAIVPIWYLMVPTKAALEKFPAPGTQTWAKVAQVLTKGVSTLPQSTIYAIVIGGLIGLALPLIEKLLVPQKYRKYFPSAMGLGLSWVVPFANSLSFTMGALIAWIWSKLDSERCEKYNVPVASGLIAGESLIAAIIAMTATALGLLGLS